MIQKPDIFIDTLCHELIHRLLTDNTHIPHETKLLTPRRELFGSDHSLRTLVHIPVHAVHKAIYLDILKEPARMKRDIERRRKFKAQDYLAAWEYVDKHGYVEIIKQLKYSYQQLAGRR